MVEGVAVLENKSGKVIHFVKASGRSAMHVLSGISINMGPDFHAVIRNIAEDDLKKIKEDPDYD